MREWNAERESVPTTRARHRQRAWKASAALKAEVARRLYCNPHRHGTRGHEFGSKRVAEDGILKYLSPARSCKRDRIAESGKVTEHIIHGWFGVRT